MIKAVVQDKIVQDAVLEILSERRPRPPVQLLDLNFKQQANFIQDPARRKALFCTRRSAKSYTGGLYLAKVAEENPGVNCLYVGLTRLSAKGIIWKDILKDIDRKYDLGLEFNGTELTATTRGGSIIYVTGMDADADEMHKQLGRKYKLVILDEAASFRQDLKELVDGILGPSVVDQSGTICMLGTSGNLTKGFFFDITTRKEQGWKLFEWTAHDNPYVAKQWQEELDSIARERPLFMETPLFKQWYLNQWVIDEEKLVYRFSYNRNEYSHLPRYSSGSWNYVLGVDLGYSPDPSAFVVAAFHDHDKTLYFLETFKKTEMDITDVAQKISEYQKLYPIHKVVIDGANKQAVQEIQRRHGITLTTADKTGKVDFIQIMNAEMIQGKVKLSPSCAPLIEEYLGLIWNDKGLKREEHPNCANHLTDAALYAWRFCYQFLAEPEKKKVNLRDRNQYIKHTETLMEEALERQINRQQADERNEASFEMAEMGMSDDPITYYINKRR